MLSNISIRLIYIQMKRTIASVLITVAACLLLNACNQQEQRKKHANWVDTAFKSDTAVQDTSQELCFMGLSGNNKDSSFVSLSILGDKIVGKHSWVPFEKDGRTGSIAGTKKGDTLDVVWEFMQEGMKDTLRTVFLLKGEQLKQKPFSVDPKNGRQITDDKSAFTIIYNKINCDTTHKK
ncbi:hypothetical protein SAMN05661044_00448 [Olivibacter domesticus]|uniref:Uncharacterized protein n=2 Tax=Olivibacter domesticus TaxID=407022 RepID=A0A1H7HTN2_OLID1|nr:hypothetical protein SAMN05661044_00448 [Olivibacter domesticus]